LQRLNMTAADLYARVQGAEFLNELASIIVDSAGDQAHIWAALDELHATYCTRLSSACSDMSVAECATTVQSCAKGLLTCGYAGLPLLRAYYLQRAAEHAAPADSGLLFALAAVAHCGGDCSREDAMSVAAAVLPSGRAMRDSKGSGMMFHLAALAPTLHGKRSGYGSGAAGCQCRVALCHALMGSMEWHPELLQARTTSDAEAVVVAAQPAGVRGRRVVVATCLDVQSSNAQGLLQLELGQDAQGGYGLYAYATGGSDVHPLRTTYVLGAVRKWSAALALLTAAASAWVQGSALDVFDGQDGMWMCGDQCKQHFSDEIEQPFWGFNNFMDGRDMSALGYAVDVQKDVLVFAALELVET
jgi:hypothetical protein